ncbi:MAG: hypothetical protein K6E11_04535 [Bacilli bacterium]|nr:hypothetical protein [Bacilli bacterium]
MNKSVKNSTKAAILFEVIAIVAFIVLPIVSQIIFGDNYAHLEAVCESALNWIGYSFTHFYTLKINYVMTVVLALVFLSFIVVWIVILAKRKNKTVVELIFCSLIYIVSYFGLVVFLLDQNPIVYNNKVELAKLDESLLVLLVKKIMNFSNSNPIYSFGMLAAFTLGMLALVFSFLAFIFVLHPKKLEEPKVVEVKEEKHVQEVKAEEAKTEDKKPVDDFDENDPIEKMFKDIESNREELKPQNPEPVKEEEEEDEVEQLEDKVLDN